VDLTNFYQDAPKRRIGFCLFNRATYARSKVLIDELLKYPNVELTLFLSSALLWERYGKAANYIEREHPRAKMVRIEMAPVPGTNRGISDGAGELYRGLVPAFDHSDCDAFILVADRWETLVAAQCAALLNRPIIHIQGGEITGCIDDKVRNAVSKLADYHFCSTRLSKEYLVQMGEDTRRIFQPGCPSIDLIRRNHVKRTNPKDRYIIAVFHPETENQEQAFDQTRSVCEAVIDYCREHRCRCEWFYPNPDPGREKITEYLDQTLGSWPHLFSRAINQEPEEFLSLLAGARLVVGNSSCGLRECSYLGIPTVNVGQRQRYRERSFNVVDVGYDQAEILQALKEQHRVGRYPKSQLYGSGNASVSIAKYIQHIDFSIKGPLTYPTWEKFRELHFGEDRFNGHRKRNPARLRQRDRLQEGTAQAQQADDHPL
jgi:UDP-hydrolysing UDP-N-acetyl-D-glucosamine 2-epimerase